MRFVFGAMVFLFFLLLLAHIVPRGNSNCELSVTNFSTDCLSSVPYSHSWPTTAVRILGDKLVFFSEEYVWEGRDDEFLLLFLNGEKSNWTRELGISPQCAIWGGEWETTLPKNTGRLVHYVRYGIGRCSDGGFKPSRIELGSTGVSGGALKIAYYFLPLGRGRWVFWPEPVFGGEIEPHPIEASCSCSLDDIIEKIDGSIRRLNFTSIKDFGECQRGPIKVVFSRLYTRNYEEYIYVECGKIKDLGLARILIVRGAKNVVMPYFTCFRKR